MTLFLVLALYGTKSSVLHYCVHFALTLREQYNSETGGGAINLENQNVWSVASVSQVWGILGAFIA